MIGNFVMRKKIKYQEPKLNKGKKKLNKEKKALENYSTQLIDKTDIESVSEALNSDFLSRGPKTDLFEKLLGDFCQNRNVISVNSATSGLQLSYQLLGVKNGSLIWTTPITFVATANAALYLGARMDFVDINADTLNVCPKLLECKLKLAKKNDNLPDIVTVVHFAGNPCEMEKIYNLSKEYGFLILEDASHALGASIRNIPIGKSNYSSASVFSFHPVKMITTGEGGAVILRSDNLVKKAKSLRSHGILNSEYFEDKPNWYYEQTELGSNYRMSELQAALGSSQMKKLTQFVKKRNSLAQMYKDQLSDLPIKFQSVLETHVSSYHLFTIEILEKTKTRDELYFYLKQKNIGCQVHYIPVHLQPFYKHMGFSKGMFQNAEQYFSRCLSLPLHQGLNQEHIELVSRTLHNFFKN